MSEHSLLGQYKLYLTEGREGLSVEARKKLQYGRRIRIIRNSQLEAAKQNTNGSQIRHENVNLQSNCNAVPCEVVEESRDHDVDIERNNCRTSSDDAMDCEAEEMIIQYKNDSNEWERLIEFNGIEIMIELDEKELHNITGFDDLLNHTPFFKSANAMVTRSPGEILLMLLTLCQHNHMSFSSIVSFTQFINIMLGKPTLPQSKHMLEKILGLKTQNCEFHVMCLHCTAYIGQVVNNSTSCTCYVCGKSMDLSNPSCLNFFIIINPCDYIADHLEQNEVYYDDVMNGKYFSNDKINDIYDGRRYREFLEQLPPEIRKRYVTAVFNSDGAPCFKSSNFSIWPVYLQLNELPPQERLKRIVTIALYFGKEKPNMATLCEPFVKIMNKISENGFHATIKNEIRLLRLFCLVACADAVARAPMQGIKQFNGHYGCAWCLHEGEYFAKSMRYPILNVDVPLARNMESHIDDIKRAVSTNSCINGVQMASPLIYLYYFNIICGFTPDYMHFFVGGAGKQCTEYMLDSIDIFDKIAVLDKIILNLKVPNLLCRLSRSLEDRGNWKAKEWENFILYYSVPLFTKFMDTEELRDKLKHWCLLVDSLHILLCDSISIENLNKAHVMLAEFVVGVESFYLKQAMTSNVHQLLHAVGSVYDWGPLWAHSNFGFESANAHLLKAIHSAKGVNLQIMRHIELQHKTRILKKRVFPSSSCLIKGFCENIDIPKIQKTFKISDIRYLGPEKLVEPQSLQRFHLSRDKSQAFGKILKDGVLYSYFEQSNERSCDSYAQLDDGRFVQCMNFIVDVHNKTEVTFVHFIHVIEIPYCKNIRQIVAIDDCLNKIATKELKKVCVHMEIDNLSYICPVVNCLYY